MVYKNIDELVGNTPIVRLDNLKKKLGLKANVLAKLEFFNPAGSIKDRVALRMILDAEEANLLSNGSTIIEPTSGNTGIGLAAIGVSKGYKVIIVMPDTMSEERIKLIRAYGAEVVLTDGKKGMTGSIEKAEELQKQIADSVVMGQFVNQSNPITHFDTTGPEIWNDTDGNLDIFISAVGTGGTITGAGAFLKKINPGIQVIGVEPSGSPILSGGKPGPHKIQGIGAGFVPDVLDVNVIDEVITVSDEEAYDFGRTVAVTEGILVGISSGAALSAAAKLALLDENADKNIVVILPDTGSRYLSTPDYY